MIVKPRPWNTGLAMAVLCVAGPSGCQVQTQVSSPDGRIEVSVTDDAGLRYVVRVDGEELLSPSMLGLRFRGDIALGPDAEIVDTEHSQIRESWTNRFGTESQVENHYNQMRVSLREGEREFGLVVRVFDGGVGLRYELPEASGLGDFVLTEEMTEMRFAEDARSWAGEAGTVAEIQYPEYRLSTLPTMGGRDGDQPYLHVLPLLAQTSQGFVAIAESDVLDWPATFLSATGTTAVRVQPAERTDGNGLVVSTAPGHSPWRVLIIAESEAELITSQLVANLATPSRIEDTSWIQPGVSAWDPWWTGENPNLPNTPDFTAVNARGDTERDKQYIDLAAEMGWSYQLVDWLWYENMTSFNKALQSEPNAELGDFTRQVPQIDLEELVDYAAEKDVRLLIWAHSLDIRTFGEEEALAYLASLGFAGIKIDFFASQSQETVQWVQMIMELAAEHELLIDLHGIYHPTGLSRTYPNYITQEGVLGNEYNKLPGNRNTPEHQLRLMFTRALLGPMDYTPGGLLSVDQEDFLITHPTLVMGSRARQLAQTVLYPSPLVVMCDAPEHYLGQPGTAFLQNLPTVWDEAVVLSAQVEDHVLLARRSGDVWYLAGMNLEARELEASLDFLPEGSFELTAFTDDLASEDPNAIEQSVSQVNSGDVLQVSFDRHGGYAAILRPAD
jgi:alpha-glucosidase